MDFAGWSYNWVMVLGLILCVRKINKNCPIFRGAGAMNMAFNIDEIIYYKILFDGYNETFAPIAQLVRA